MVVMSVSEHLAVLRAYKEDKGCKDCGYKYPHFILEFDHKPGYRKLDNVYRVLKRYGIEMAWKEIRKCDVVCSNCHKIRTNDREES